MSKFIGIGPGLAEALHRAGVVQQDMADVRRIVIDLEAGRVGKVYVETYADDEKLRVALTGGLEVVTQEDVAA